MKILIEVKQKTMSISACWTLKALWKPCWIATLIKTLFYGDGYCCLDIRMRRFKRKFEWSLMMQTLCAILCKQAWQRFNATFIWSVCPKLKNLLFITLILLHCFSLSFLPSPSPFPPGRPQSPRRFPLTARAFKPPSSPLALYSNEDVVVKVSIHFYYSS